MSNELAVLDAQLPSYLKELEMDKATKALMGSGPSGKRISIKGGVWRMMVNGKEVAKNEDRAMNVVIVNAADKVSRSYYAGTYVEGAEPTKPDCASVDGEVPDANVTNKQADRCVDCPQNVKGSGQGDSRACRFNQRIAVVLANDIAGDVFQMVLPGQSIFGSGEPGKWPLQTYARMIGSKGIPVTAVVTEMRFDTNSATPKVTFKPLRVLEAAEHQTILQQGTSDAARRAITMNVAETDGVTAAPKALEKPAAKETPAESTAPTPPPAASATESEPKVRAKKEEPKAAPKADINTVLKEWDD